MFFFFLTQCVFVQTHNFGKSRFAHAILLVWSLVASSDSRSLLSTAFVRQLVRFDGRHLPPLTPAQRCCFANVYVPFTSLCVSQTIKMNVTRACRSFTSRQRLSLQSFAAVYSMLRACAVTKQEMGQFCSYLGD